MLCLVIFIAILLRPVANYAEARKAWVSTESTLLDRDGETIHALRVDHKARRLEWISIDDMSPMLIHTLLQAEDRRFYQHHGVDMRSGGAALWNALRRGPSRGASTISMQLAGILDPGLQAKSTHRTTKQKFLQMLSATKLDARWSKKQILEAYLNYASFRGELQGVAAASKGLFGKTPSGLDANESLILIASLRAPNATAETVAQRACKLSNEAEANVDCTKMRLRVQAALAHRAPDNDNGIASHAAHELVKVSGTSITSSIDKNLQQYATEVLRQQLTALKDQHVADGAALVVDNQTGAVLAYVGNGGELASSAMHVDGVKARRSAGSTLKPFLYQLALEQKLLTAASLLEDTPVNIPTATGLYVPQNYDKDFKGWVSMRSALAGSLNVPAVRTQLLTGANPFASRLNALGFDSLKQAGDYYGYSLALGSAEVSLWELVNAYRTLANGGQWSAISLNPAAEPNKIPLLDPGASFIISDILADRSARSITFGFENPLATPYWSAVKTGTSKDMRDNWCIGYSRRYTVGVWVGNFNGQPMQDVSGVTGAAPVWLSLMNALNARSKQKESISIPPTLLQTNVAFEKNIEAARSEWFIEGTQTSLVGLKSANTRSARITYPTNGTLIAYDPDIPAKLQRVIFKSTAENTKQQWSVDNAAVSSKQSLAAWQPQPGTHVLRLHNPSGEVMDQIEFQVRGTSKKIQYNQ
jgi:penicillin-binding protein 1C